MAEILRNLTDDQTALLGCFGALAVSMLMLSISFRTRSPHSQPSSIPISEDSSKPSDQKQKQAA
ncbi:MAG: hypothetical protein KDA80_07995 [Planctomycetaceae bacterium]|nr:hypothetical protein [Planctomycetaceae bacterium]